MKNLIIFGCSLESEIYPIIESVRVKGIAPREIIHDNRIRYSHTIYHFDDETINLNMLLIMSELKKYEYLVSVELTETDINNLCNNNEVSISKTSTRVYLQIKRNLHPLNPIFRIFSDTIFE